MARSDIWRFRRYENKARDLAHVTSGIGSYFGSAARDRSYRVTWQPIADTFGGTDTKHKVVYLNPALLDKFSEEAPFSSESVDMMQGIAAHEAGHAALMARHHEDSTEGGYVTNVVEDFMIDGPAFRAYNPGLADETEANRMGAMADEFVPPLDKFWRDGPTPATGQQLLSTWACARLFRHRLPDIAARKFEKKWVELLDAAAKDVWALTSFDDGNALATRTRTIADIEAIIGAYSQQPETKPENQKPGQQPEGEGDDEGDGSEGDGPDCDGVPGEGSGKGKSSGKKSKGKGKGQPVDEEEDEDERINSGAGSGEGEGDGETEGTDDGGDGDGDESDEDGEGDGDGEGSSDGEAGGKGAGGASKTPVDWSKMVPDVCPSMHGAERDEDAVDHEFWSEVAKELTLLDVDDGKVQGKVHLARFTDKKTVAAIRSAYGRLASEPVRQRHHDAGRLDRRAYPRVFTSENVFARNREKALTGKLVMVLDLSGSVNGMEGLVKSAAASMYEALSTSTDLKVWVYSYGAPAVAELATPKKVDPKFALVRAGGGTPTAAALATVLDAVDPGRGGSNVILHVTDGVADDVAGAQAQMKEARKRGWKVINIGVGSSGRNLPYAQVSDSVQFIQDYTKLPKLIEAAVGDIVKGHKRGLAR